MARGSLLVLAEAIAVQSRASGGGTTRPLSPRARALLVKDRNSVVLGRRHLQLR